MRFVYSFVAFTVILCVNVLAGRYALLIGCNDGGESVRPLAFAESDTKQFADILARYGSFESTDIDVLVHPDSMAIVDAFKRLAKKVSSNGSNSENTALVYYSGHADIGGLLLEGKHFPFETFYAMFGAIGSNVRIGIVDACYSGIVTAFKGGARAEPLFFENVQNVKGQVIIASSAANERAQESPTLKSSVFSFHLFNGLRGSADASGDKKVTLNEVYQYAYRKTVETSALTSGEIQHPVYKFNIQGQGDIVLTRFDQMSSGILFDKNCGGKYLVLSENYLDVFADFFKEKGSEQFISLNPGKYTIIRAFQKDIGTMTLTIGDSKTRHIRDFMFSPDFITESRVKGPPEQSDTVPQSQQYRPLSQVSFAVGSGLSLKYNDDTKLFNRDAVLHGMVLWYIKEYIDFYISLYGYPSVRDVSLLFGLDYIVNRTGDVRYIAGALAGIYYDYKRESTDNAIPVLGLQGGIAFRLGPHTDFGLTVPLFIGFDREPQYRTGLNFRVQFYRAMSKAIRN